MFPLWYDKLTTMEGVVEYPTAVGDEATFVHLAL